jgi:hypothetical protein
VQLTFGGVVPAGASSGRPQPSAYCWKQCHIRGQTSSSTPRTPAAFAFRTKSTLSLKSSSDSPTCTNVGGSALYEGSVLSLSSARSR